MEVAEIDEVTNSVKLTSMVEDNDDNISMSASSSSHGSQEDDIDGGPVVPVVRKTSRAYGRRPTRRSIDVPDYNETVPHIRDQKRTAYEEAALFLQEGVNNEIKFDSHPNAVYSKMAFRLIHHPVFYTAEFIVCCLLLALAIIEEPYLINIFKGNKAATLVVHSCLEMVLLSLIAGSILLKFIWMKPKTFLRQGTTFAVVIMIIMFFEALVVLIRRENHFRVTRCLRPIFFIDSILMVGVRRVLRQIAQCILAIIDVFLLVFLMVAIFSFAAYYLFSEINPVYFDNFLKSFLSLFIGLTTANHPDVFMSAYVHNRASALFFVLYLFVTLFFLMNVLLGVIFASFSAKDKEKSKKLYLHKREALRNAYFVLVTPSKGVSFRDFLLFMKEYKPRTPEYQVICIFKALQNDADPQEYLCLEEFYNFYEMQNLNWQQIKEGTEVYTWYENFPRIINKIFKRIHKIERFRGFDYIMTIVVLLNASYLMIFAIVTSYYCGEDQAGNAGISIFRDKLLQYCNSDRFKASRDSLIGSFVFTGIYLIEILIRLLAVGPYEYFRKKWNIYDSTVLIISLICLIIEATIPSLGILVIFRPVKLFRIIKLKKRYYRLMSAVTYLRERLLSVLLLLLVIFYFYAIIGMEVFRGSVYVGCCESAYYGVEVHYSGNATEPTPQSYWMNNFDNIYQSYIILYEQMVVNNWFIQMEGFVSETTIYARLYFVSFWMTTSVCLSVVIAYIVDAFMISHEANVSKYQDQQKCDKHTWFKCNCIRIKRKKNIMVRFTKDEVKQIIKEIDEISQQVASKEGEKCSINRFLRRLYSKRIELQEDRDEDVVKFIGKGLQTKEYINLEKYKDELQGWIKENEKIRKKKKKKRKERKESEKNMSIGKRLCQFLTKALKAAAKYIVE